MDEGESLVERRPDRIGKLHRRGTGSALRAVHRDEVRRDPRRQHGLHDAQKLMALADAQLESDRLPAGCVAELFHEVEQPRRGRKRGVRRRRDHVLAGGDPANLDNLRGELLRRQNAAVPGFGTLRQLDLDHFHIRQRCPFCELLHAETAGPVAAAEIPRPDLPDEVPTRLQVIGTQAAFAGIVGKTTDLGTCVEREHGVLAERAVAHARHVEHRCGVRLPAIGATHEDPRPGIVDVRRCQGMIDPLVSRSVDITLGPKG